MASSPEDLSVSNSESDYVPETSETDDSDLFIPTKYQQPTSSKTHAEVSSDAEGSASTSAVNDPGQKKCTLEVEASGEQETLLVKDTKVLGVEKKIKRNCCYYCGIYVTRITRHLYTHCNEREILKIMSLKKEKRLFYLKELKLKGNFRHNVGCISKGKGNLIVMRSPRSVNNGSQFIPCPYCYGFLSKRELSKHCQSCPYKPENFELDRPLKQGKLMLCQYLGSTLSEELKTKVLVKMRDDDVKAKVIGDSLILGIGDILACKLRASKGEKYQYVSNRMRNLGKLLLECEKIKQGMSLSELLVPSNFDFVIQCVNKMCVGVDKPKSLGLKIGHALRKACEIARCRAIKSNNEKRKKEAEEFMVLMNAEWSDRISSSLLRELYDDKLNKDIILPVTADLMTLTKYVNERVLSSLDNILEIPSEENYFSLAKMTLCKLIIFNKRRGGEVSRMSVSDFVLRAKWSSKNNEDVLSSLSALEKKLVDRLDLIKVRGKRGRHVPILITPEVTKAMEVLVREREYVSIKNSNHFFFANHGDGYLRGHDVLHDVVKLLNLQNPGSITSTNLRKYVATVTQIVSLEKEELEWVADHLGHSIEVHRDFYRLQESTLELGKVSKLLLAVENGFVHKIAGKKLSDITMEDCFPEGNDCEVNKEREKAVYDFSESEGISNDELQRQPRKKQKRVSVSEEIEKVQKSTGMKKLWDTETKGNALKHFKIFINSKKVPRKTECEKFLEKYGVTNRSWKDVKYLVYNISKSLPK